MIAALIDYCARNRLIVFLCVGGLALLGYVAMYRTPLDALPDLSDTQVIVYTTWPGSIMIVYLDQAYQRRLEAGQMNSMHDLFEAVMEGSVQRLRPKLMTVGANIFGLMPVMWATGTGADTMKRIGAPLIGGLISSTILTLILLPAICTIWKGFEVRRRGRWEG